MKRRSETPGAARHFWRAVGRVCSLAGCALVCLLLAALLWALATLVYSQM
jgi:hypothetical protein